MLRRLAFVAIAAPALAFAQFGSQTQEVKPPDKRPNQEDLKPAPSPLEVESEAVKLPEKQFEIPPDKALPSPPPPDEPPPPGEPPKKDPK